MEVEQVMELKNGMFTVYLKNDAEDIRWELLQDIPVKHINISGSSIHPIRLVEKISRCEDLEKLVMRNCPQISAENIIDMCKKLPSLIYLDCVGCSSMMAIDVWRLLSIWRNIQVVMAEPKLPKTDLKNWRSLFLMFPDVKFGDDIKNLCT